MYQFKLSKNAKHENQSIEGFNLKKNIWSGRRGDKPSKLIKHLRTRKNKDGLVDYRYLADGGQTVLFDSEVDCDTNVTLYHKSELGNMSRPELLRLAESYDITYAPKMNTEMVASEVLKSQNEYEATLSPEDIEQNLSSYRKFILEQDKVKDDKAEEE